MIDMKFPPFPNTDPYSQSVGKWISKAPNLHRIVYLQHSDKLKNAIVKLKSKESQSRYSWLSLEKELNQTAGPYQLTLLHLAIMKGNQAMIDILLLNNVRLDCPDHRGFTGLHHAVVLGDEESINKLIKKGASLCSLTFRGAMPSDLAHMRGFNSILTQVRWWNKSRNEVIERPVRDVLGPGISFTNEVITPIEILHEDWWLGETLESRKSYADEDRFLEQIILQQYPSFHQYPPPVAITDSSQDDLGGCIKGIGLAIVAAKNILPGAICCEYGGKHRDKNDSSDCEYTILNIDARNPRSYGGLIPDGMPNAIFWPINYKGRNRCVVVALETIQKGQLIVGNYGRFHQVKGLKNRIEPRPHALQQFLSKGISHYHFTMFGLYRLIFTEKGSGLVKWHMRAEIIIYILETPYTYLYAVIEGHIPPSQLQKFAKRLQIETPFKEWVNNTFILFEKSLSTLPAFYQTRIRQAILESLKTRELHQTVHLIHLVAFNKKLVIRELERKTGKNDLEKLVSLRTINLHQKKSFFAHRVCQFLNSFIKRVRLTFTQCKKNHFKKLELFD